MCYRISVYTRTGPVYTVPAENEGFFLSYRLFGQNENFGTKTGHHVTQKLLRPTQWKFNGQCT